MGEEIFEEEEQIAQERAFDEERVLQRPIRTLPTLQPPMLSIFLYRVDFNKAMRAGWSGVGSLDGRSHLPLDLHFLLTAWAANAEFELRILGRAMQCLETYPSLSGPLLAGPSWATGDSVQVVLEEISTEAVMRTFDSLPYDGHGEPMSFLDVAENFGVFLDHACGGVCACTTCHIHVREGEAGISEPEEKELDRLDQAAGIELKSRLGCQAVIEKPGTVVVEIPAWNRNYVSEGH